MRYMVSKTLYDGVKYIVENETDIRNVYLPVVIIDKPPGWGNPKKKDSIYLLRHQLDENEKISAEDIYNKKIFTRSKYVFTGDGVDTGLLLKKNEGLYDKYHLECTTNTNHLGWKEFYDFDISTIEKFNDVVKKIKTTHGSGGGKKHSKKDILGKSRCIYKIKRDCKEYVKHKGKLITVKEYKSIIKTKASKPKKQPKKKVQKKST